MQKKSPPVMATDAYRGVCRRTKYASSDAAIQQQRKPEHVSVRVRGKLH